MAETDTNPYCHAGMVCQAGCGCAAADGICRCGMMTDTKCYCNSECAAQPQPKSSQAE